MELTKTDQELILAYGGSKYYIGAKKYDKLNSMMLYDAEDILSDSNFIDAIEDKMMEEVGYTEFHMTMDDDGWCKVVYFQSDCDFQKMTEGRADNQDRREAKLSAILNYLTTKNNSKEMK